MLGNVADYAAVIFAVSLGKRVLLGEHLTDVGVSVEGD